MNEEMVRGSEGRFSLRCKDQGTRSGRRSQIVLDTSARTIEVWRDAEPHFRAALQVAAQSEPLDPAAIGDRNSDVSVEEPSEN